MLARLIVRSGNETSDIVAFTDAELGVLLSDIEEALSTIINIDQ